MIGTRPGDAGTYRADHDLGMLTMSMAFVVMSGLAAVFVHAFTDSLEMGLAIGLVVGLLVGKVCGSGVNRTGSVRMRDVSPVYLSGGRDQRVSFG